MAQSGWYCKEERPGRAKEIQLSRARLIREQIPTAFSRRVPLH